MRNKIKLIGHLENREVTCEADVDQSDVQDLVALYIKFLHLCGYDIPQDIMQSIDQYYELKK